VATEHLLLRFAVAKPVPDSPYNDTGSFLALLPPAADQLNLGRQLLLLAGWLIA
jgi:hypothetical protein